MLGDTPKRFEDWEEIDCNECVHYWDNSCDSVSEGSRKPCNSFLATRSVVIPAQIKALDKRLKCLGAALITLSIINLILWAVYIRG